MGRVITLLVLTVSVFAMFWAARPLDDADIYTQIVLGKWFPAHIRLASTEDPTHVFIGWLAQVLLSTLEHHFGLSGVKVLNLACLVCSFLFLGLWHTRLPPARKPESLSIVAITSGLVSAFVVSASNTSARPQSLAYLFFSALLVFASSWQASQTKKRYRLTFLFTLLIVWQNAHPSIVLAAPVLLCCTIRSTRDLIVFVPWALALFATPDGWNIFSLSAINAETSRSLLGISEWLPPWHSSVRDALWGFWGVLASTALMAILTACKRKPLPLVPLTLSLIFVPLSLYSSRFSVFWGFVNAPLFGELFASLWPGTLARIPIAQLRIRTALPGIFLALTTTAVINQLHLTPSMPLGAFKNLKATLREARIFNYREFGGALEYVGYPGWTVFIDGRLYLYPGEVWQSYHDISFALSPEQLPGILRNYDLLVLHPDFQQRLISELKGGGIPGSFIMSTTKLVVFRVEQEKGR